MQSKKKKREMELVDRGRGRIKHLKWTADKHGDWQQ